MPTPPDKKDLLKNPVEHVDITAFDARPIIDAYAKTAFQARNLATAAAIYDRMLADTGCGIILTLAGSLVSAGMKEAIITLLEHNMVDAIVSTGANIVDQDFFEGLGFQHWIAPGSPEAPVVDDPTLRGLMIDRIYDTYIDEEELRECDEITRQIFDELPPRAFSSRELVEALGAYLDEHRTAPGTPGTPGTPGSPGISGSPGTTCRSFVHIAYQRRIPIFVPAFSDCSAGFGIVAHQTKRHAAGMPAVTFDSGADFRELTELKLACGDTGLLMLGGGVPKNFAQDVVVAAEILGHNAPMHKYAIQLTVADSRDGALSGSTLREACSWGKVDVIHEQMVFGEATTTFPLLASAAYHRGHWKSRTPMKLADHLRPASTPA